MKEALQLRDETFAKSKENGSSKEDATYEAMADFQEYFTEHKYGPLEAGSYAPGFDVEEAKEGGDVEEGGEKGEDDDEGMDAEAAMKVAEKEAALFTMDSDTDVGIEAAAISSKGDEAAATSSKGDGNKKKKLKVKLNRR